MKNITKKMVKDATITYLSTIIKIQSDAGIDSVQLFIAKDDLMFDAIQSGISDPIHLQREFKIGFNRATQIAEHLQLWGIAYENNGETVIIHENCRNELAHFFINPFEYNHCGNVVVDSFLDKLNNTLQDIEEQKAIESAKIRILEKQHKKRIEKIALKELIKSGELKLNE